MILQMTRPVQAGLRQERKLDVTANHLANVNTTGFKKDVLSFDKAMKANLGTDLTQGPVRETGNTLDIALEDEGFFKIQTWQGTRYTRNGNFTINNNNELVTQQGDLVLDDGGAPILIEGDNIDINERGQIQVDGELNANLAVVTFNNLENLHKEGSGLFVYKGNTQDEIVPPNIMVRQKALESSNVQTVVEMTKMIEYHRMYESALKMVQSFDEIDGKAINEVGKLM